MTTSLSEWVKYSLSHSKSVQSHGERVFIMMYLYLTVYICDIKSSLGNYISYKVKLLHTWSLISVWSPITLIYTHKIHTSKTYTLGMTYIKYILLCCPGELNTLIISVRIEHWNPEVISNYSLYEWWQTCNIIFSNVYELFMLI